MQSENRKDNYHILSLLGSGAYGNVYKGRRKYTGQFVAIKCIKKKSKEEKDLKVMRDEIQILKNLKHQNIILLLDAFETSSEFVLITELGQGELFNIIEDDHYLQEPEIRRIAQQLVGALNYIHSNRVMHRDMKPQNILMTSDGLVKLCDFGFARHMSCKTEMLTSLKGTPLYMAPEVVKEEPYNHTADLWSLGIVLYELATGSPPFTAPNLVILVEHISKDPIIYPNSISGDFLHFLKGLLNKDPQKRLGWPQLLSHPFIKETDQQRSQRKRKTEQFSGWVEENHCNQQNGSQIANQAGSFSQGGFEDIIKDSAIKKQGCKDPLWNNYLRDLSDDKRVTHLRSDPTFLEALLKVFTSNISEIMRSKQKKEVLQAALKVFSHVMIHAKKTNNDRLDIAQNPNLPNLLLGTLSGLLKVDDGKRYLDILSDITRLVGMLARATYEKTTGVQLVYIRSFLPELARLTQIAVSSNDQTHQTLLINMLRTLGTLINNASMDSIRNYVFYRDLVELKYVPQFKLILKHPQNSLPVLKLLVQVLSALAHPVYGDIECFPWGRESSKQTAMSRQSYIMFECLRQEIANCFLEGQCGVLIEKMLVLDQLLPKISMARVLLQCARISKDFCEYLIIKEINVIKLIFQLLCSKDQNIYTTGCELVSQLIKYCRERKKEKILQSQINQYLPAILERLKDDNQQSNLLGTFTSLLVLQELVTLDNHSWFLKILEHVLNEKAFMRIICQLIANPQISKLEQMRKIEGSNYGLHCQGLYDPAFMLLHKLVYRVERDYGKKYDQLLKVLRESRLEQHILTIMVNLNSKVDLSPKGLISLMLLVFNLMSKEIGDEFAQQSFLEGLINLLRKEQQIESLRLWPGSFGGGETYLSTMFGNIVKLFLLYMHEAERQPTILKIIYDKCLIELMIQFTKYLQAESLSSVVTLTLYLMAFDKDIGKYDGRSFVKQFINVGGMSLFSNYNLLKEDHYPVSSLIDSINLLSQIAKMGKQSYEAINSINPFQYIRKLVRHSEPSVRSRTLNLIGNILRHSTYFYRKIDQHQILKECIKMCDDPDKNISKFACVVVGNSSFYDDTLYGSLRPAVPILVSLLMKETEEKARSNAIAALGNLARNSATLDREFVVLSAPVHLLNLLTTDKSLAVKKVVVLAIHNMLGLPESRKMLLGQNVGAMLQKLLVPPYSNDAPLFKAVQKAIDKFNSIVSQGDIIR